MGSAEEVIANAKDKRGNFQVQLEDTMKFLRTIAPGCDYITVNFQVRKQNRADEIDGLLEAKAALEGGSFASQKAAVAEDTAARTVSAAGFLQQQGGEIEEC